MKAITTPRLAAQYRAGIRQQIAQGAAPREIRRLLAELSLSDEALLRKRGYPPCSVCHIEQAKLVQLVGDVVICPACLEQAQRLCHE